jgi:hypothetical protein
LTQLHGQEPVIDPISTWNQEFLRAVRLSSTAPGLASRNLAIMHSAIYDGMASIRGEERVIFTRIQPDTKIDESAFLEIIGAEMVRVFYPSLSGAIQTKLDNRLAGLDSDAISTARAFSKRIMKAAFEAREQDGAANTLTYIPKDEIGKWRRTPPDYRPPELSHWYNVHPFVLPAVDFLRPPPPPPLNSEPYAASLNEVEQMGSLHSTLRTSEQTQIAEFWSCFSYTSTPAGHWNLILGNIITNENVSDHLFIARAYALLNLALADVGIAAWDCKYHYEFWRPVQAIRQADEDNNPETRQDPVWESLLEAPPHPEYVSGHSAFSSAGARMLMHVFGTDAISFTAHSETFPDDPRHYDSLWACAEECGISRIYGGIHYGFSNRAGLELGKQVADYVFANVL